MKFILIFFASLMINTVSAQIKVYSLSNVPTDTTKGLTGNKWAIMDVHNSITLLSGMLVEFENGSRVNLYQILHTDTSLAKSNNAYVMQALEYMDRRGFKLITIYESNNSGIERFIFQQK
jgi:hypothetical protein